jgi:hypothetical protein
MLMYDHQNAGQNHYIKTADGTLENVVEFKYLKATNQNLLHEKITTRLGTMLQAECNI